VDEPEAGGGVDPARGDQDALGPEGDLPVARLPGEADALLDEPRADAEPARPRVDREQPQLGHRLRLPDEEHRAHVTNSSKRVSAADRSSPLLNVDQPSS
jgi:hypothetical protein